MTRARRFTSAPSPGAFITLEGIEGSGKSTQLAKLAKSLREAGYRVIETREPGGTPIAEDIREVLLDGSAAPDNEQRVPAGEEMTAECEAALVFAARSQHVRYRIRPGMAEGA